MSMTLGYCAGIFSSVTYRTKHSPEYRRTRADTRLRVLVMLSVLGGVSAAQAEQRDRCARKWKMPEEIARLGGHHPHYRYLY